MDGHGWLWLMDCRVPAYVLDYSDPSHWVILTLLVIPCELLWNSWATASMSIMKGLLSAKMFWVDLYRATVRGSMYIHVILWLSVTVPVSPSNLLAPAKGRYQIFFFCFLLRLFFCRSSIEGQVLCQMLYMNCCFWSSQCLLNLYKQNESLWG